MKIIINNILPLGRHFIAINLFGVVFAKKSLTNVCINHEFIHSAQQKEMAWIFFYLWYVIEWTIRLLITLSPLLAYRNISFEREAYDNQTKFNYVNTRKRFTWMKYLYQHHYSSN